MTTIPELKGTIILGILEEAAALPEGAARVETERYTRDPYGRVRVEINPTNAQASYFEVSVNDVNAVVFIGDNGITDEIPMVDAVERGNVAEYVRGLFRAVASGNYTETLWKHRGHVVRVHGQTVVDGNDTVFEQGSRRLARGCSQEVVKYPPYA
jgi:hypothetical protein